MTKGSGNTLEPFLVEIDMAGLTGLEPATSGVTGRRCNRLYYSPVLVGEEGLEPPTSCL